MKQLWEIFWSFSNRTLHLRRRLRHDPADPTRGDRPPQVDPRFGISRPADPGTIGPRPYCDQHGRLRRIQTLGAPRRLRIAAGRRAAVVPHHPGDRPLLRGHPSEPRRRCSLQRNAPGGRCPDHRSAGHPHAGHALEHDRAGRRTGRTDLVAGSFTGTDSCRRCRCRHRLGIVYRKKSKQ